MGKVSLHTIMKSILLGLNRLLHNEWLPHIVLQPFRNHKYKWLWKLTETVVLRNTGSVSLASTNKRSSIQTYIPNTIHSFSNFHTITSSYVYIYVSPIFRIQFKAASKPSTKREHFGQSTGFFLVLLELDTAFVKHLFDDKLNVNSSFPVRDLLLFHDTRCI